MLSLINLFVYVFGSDIWSISHGQSEEHKGAKIIRHNASHGRCWL